MGKMERGSVQADHPGWHHLVTAIVGVAQYGAFAILGVEITYIGYWAFRGFPYPYSMIVGMGLGGIGISVFFVSFYELLVRLLSVRYTRTHCIICRRE